MSKCIRRGVAGLLTGLACAGWSAPAAAELSAPEAVPAGGTFQITWTGDKPEGGRFAVASAACERVKWIGFGYFRDASTPIKLSAPVRPGTYAIAAQKDGALACLATFEVTPVTATLEAPESVMMNSDFQVRFTGPRYGQDIIAVTDVASDARSGSYSYPGNAKSDQVKLKAPLTPGAFEIIYKMRDQVLARVPLQVQGAQADLTAPATVQAGADLEVAWNGPNNPGDLVSLVEPGTDVRSTVYQYTGLSTAGRLFVTVPETLGAFELIYKTGDTVLARRPIEIVAVSAAINARDRVVAGQSLAVTWDGPANRQDAIVMVPAGQALERPFGAITYIVADEPQALMQAPAEPGVYDLHYRTRAGSSLAQARVEVLRAPAKPGWLNVTGRLAQRFGPNSAVEIILDASGSMLQRQGTDRRIDIAKTTINDLVQTVIPAGTAFALRIFGHKEAGRCRTDLELPLDSLDVAAVQARVSTISAKNLAKTPIAASLAKVASDLSGVTGERVVVLITDGEETCDGDPLLAIRALRAAGQDLRVNIVGYAIDDTALQETFASWASSGGGSYLDAPDAQSLQAAMKQALAIPFEVYRDDELVATAVTGAPSMALQAGSYVVRYRIDGADQTRLVQVDAEKTLQLELP